MILFHIDRNLYKGDPVTHYHNRLDDKVMGIIRNDNWSEMQLMALLKCISGEPPTILFKKEQKEECNNTSC